MTDDDPFGLPIGRGGVKRDGYDRPMLFPRGINVRQAYTSASGLAEFITSGRGLVTWEKRYLARGLGMREDLAALAGAEVYTTGFDMEDEAENKESGRRLDVIIDRALEAAKIHEKADYGTAAHQLTEPGQVEAGGYVPERMHGDVEEMNRLLGAVEIVATEVFVANDRFMAAGTFDHLVRVPGFDGLLIVDKKFGKNIKPGEWSVQTVVYAGGDVYQDDVRTSFEEKYGAPVNQQWGLIASVVSTGHPQRLVRDRDGSMVPAPPGKLIPIDLTSGHVAAEHAVWVREWRKDKSQMKTPLDVTVLTRERVAAMLLDITTLSEAQGIFAQYQSIWTDRLTQIANRALDA